MHSGKISMLNVVALIAVAVIVDLVQAAVSLIHFIPLVGNALAAIVTAFISVFVWLSFYVWFKMLGVNLFRPKKALAFAGGGLLELIPALNALPGWTLAVILTIVFEKKEELLGSKFLSLTASKGAKISPRTKFNIFQTPGENMKRERETQLEEMKKRRAEKQKGEKVEEGQSPQNNESTPSRLPPSVPPIPPVPPQKS